MTKRRLLLAALLFGLMVAGCNRNGLVSAKGRLTWKGQPVPSTYVYFWPDEEGKRRSTGLTDDDGNFTLSFSRTEPGVLLGGHTVFLKYYVSTDEELHKIQPKASRELKDVIAKYPDNKSSKLHYEITHGGQFIDVKIE